jgi:hypothetical protein
MRFRISKRRASYVALLAAVVVFAVFLVLNYLFPWTELNCSHQDIDINSGRVRHIRFLIWVEIDENIQETWLSLAAVGRGPPRWHRVSTFSPGTGHSPHYLYHSAVAQIEAIEKLDELVKFVPAARAQVANQVLQLWQHGSDDAVAEYLDELSRIVMSLHQKGIKKLSIHDLPRGQIGQAEDDA